jgi:hypothetical protein
MIKETHSLPPSPAPTGPRQSVARTSICLDQRRSTPPELPLPTGSHFLFQSVASAITFPHGRLLIVIFSCLACCLSFSGSLPFFYRHQQAKRHAASSLSYASSIACDEAPRKSTIQQSNVDDVGMSSLYTVESPQT